MWVRSMKNKEFQPKFEFVYEGVANLAKTYGGCFENDRAEEVLRALTRR